MTQAQRRQLVDCPWLRRRGHDDPSAPFDGAAADDDDECLRRQGRETAAAICSPFGSADGRTFPSPDVVCGPGRRCASPCSADRTGQQEGGEHATHRVMQLLREHLKVTGVAMV